MSSKILVRELRPINIKGGYVIDGFPYEGLSNAIATQSMINTMQFEMIGVLDSDLFPPVSIIKDGFPHFPTEIFVNPELKVAIFSSYLTPDESVHRQLAEIIIEWARKHRCSLILSSAVIASDKKKRYMIGGIGSTDAARKILKKSDIPSMPNGTVLGIPGILLNEGFLSDTNVIVLLFNTTGKEPGFRTGAEICMTMSKLLPRAVCDLDSLLYEAEKAEKVIKRTEREAMPLKYAIYR